MSIKNLTDWQSLGLALGLLYPTLKKIDDDQHGKTDRCVMEMIAAWLQQQDNVSKKGVLRGRCCKQLSGRLERSS